MQLATISSPRVRPALARSAASTSLTRRDENPRAEPVVFTDPARLRTIGCLRLLANTQPENSSPPGAGDRRRGARRQNLLHEKAIDQFLESRDRNSACSPDGHARDLS